MRDLYVSLIYLSFLVLGVGAPFVFSLGYVWVDVFYPQYLTDTLIHFVPVSLIMGVAALGGYVVMDRRAPPPFSAITVLTVAMAGWVTLTTLWAEVPDAAWLKWDWAFKTVAFSAFLPFVIRTRVQIEAFLQVWLLASMAHLLPVGIKTLISGGGYGVSLGLLQSNASGLSESSEVAGVAMMMVPIALALRKHSVLVPAGRLRDALYYGLAFTFVFTAVGTFARTAVIGFAVVGISMWLRSRRKILFTVMAGIMAVGVVWKASTGWEQRISTIESYEQESSAYTRILVWSWTLGFVRDHPFGGGFNTYRVNRIEVPHGDGPTTVEFGRAFHSAYFEVLGEHGFPGAALFATLVVLSLLSLRATLRQTRGLPSLAWARDLAAALMTALLTLLACGAFIGIAFQPMFWYLFAMSLSMRAYVARVTSGHPEGERRKLGPTPEAVPAGAVPAGLAPAGGLGMRRRMAR